MEIKANILSIIVTYNGAEWISKCIGSIEKSNLHSDVIVIDNHSTDGTISILKENFPSVMIVELNKNEGFGYANNVGLKQFLSHNYDYAFLLNQDAWIQPDTLDILVKAQLNQPQFGIISPIHLNKEGSGLELLFSRFIEPSKCPNLYSDIYAKSIKDTLYEIPFINAAAWLLSKSCVEKIGGFSPVFYHYGEDDNYCLRAIYHHVKIGIAANAEIIHAKENYDSDLESENEKLLRQRVVLYSDPARFHLIDKEISIQNRSSLKSLLKLDFINFKNFRSKYKYLKHLREEIEAPVKQSMKIGPNFLVQ